MKITSADLTNTSCYEQFFLDRFPHVFDCMVEGSYGWCRFTEHDYGDFRKNPEVQELIVWLKAHEGGFFMEQAGQGDIQTPFTLYVENLDTAILLKLTWG